MDQQHRKLIHWNPKKKDITRKYSNGEVTVVWRPSLCQHTMICFDGLPEVFDPDRKPWIVPDAASTQAIVDQVKACPSGALTFVTNNPVPVDEEKPPVSVEVLPNGPLLVRGTITLKDKEGNHVTKGPVTALCRCGATRNKPFCDGEHARNGFKG